MFLANVEILICLFKTVYNSKEDYKNNKNNEKGVLFEKYPLPAKKYFLAIYNQENNTCNKKNDARNIKIQNKDIEFSEKEYTTNLIKNKHENIKKFTGYIKNDKKINKNKSTKQRNGVKKNKLCFKARNKSIDDSQNEKKYDFIILLEFTKFLEKKDISQEIAQNSINQIKEILQEQNIGKNSKNKFILKTGTKVNILIDKNYLKNKPFDKTNQKKVIKELKSNEIITDKLVCVCLESLKNNKSTKKDNLILNHSCNLLFNKIKLLFYRIMKYNASKKEEKYQIVKCDEFYRSILLSSDIFKTEEPQNLKENIGNPDKLSEKGNFLRIITYYIKETIEKFDFEEILLYCEYNLNWENLILIHNLKINFNDPIFLDDVAHFIFMKNEIIAELLPEYFNIFKIFINSKIDLKINQPKMIRIISDFAFIDRITQIIENHNKINCVLDENHFSCHDEMKETMRYLLFSILYTFQNSYINPNYNRFAYIYNEISQFVKKKENEKYEFFVLSLLSGNFLHKREYHSSIVNFLEFLNNLCSNESFKNTCFIDDKINSFQLLLELTYYLESIHINYELKDENLHEFFFILTSLTKIYTDIKHDFDKSINIYFLEKILSILKSVENIIF